MNTYYRSKITGNIIVNEGTIKFIYGDNGINKLINDNVIEKIDPPTMLDVIENGTTATAITRYRELHPNCSIKEAMEAINELIKWFEERYGRKIERGM